MNAITEETMKVAQARLIIAEYERKTDALRIGQDAVRRGLTQLDLREWRRTPSGGGWDGKIIPVQTAEQVAAAILGWFRPDVAIRRAREILGV